MHQRSSRYQSDTYARRVFSDFDAPTARPTNAAASVSNCTGVDVVLSITAGAEPEPVLPSVSRSITAAG